MFFNQISIAPFLRCAETEKGIGPSMKPVFGSFFVRDRKDNGLILFAQNAWALMQPVAVCVAAASS